jgi:hypothetical protein
MSECRIETHGFYVGHLYIPPFSLGRGECVTIVLPVESCANHEPIVAALTGPDAVSGLTRWTPVVFAEPASVPTGWKRWFAPVTPFAWMKKHTALSDYAIDAFLQAHRMNRRIGLNCCAGTPRAVLGLMAALARSPGVIVFSTAGLDPLGIRETFQIVSDHLPECSAIYLASPYYSQGQLCHNHLPGSLSVSVLIQEAMPLTQNAKAMIR